ncbi:(Fe-S)-binding protein [Clostridium tarantellae]|uniref:Cysteine-rich domain-containing protein n=1 Tax=Clostridium tarantellae TaxID=39493 RepID=A0A6I1MRM5_9CLOT|nr:(Fe-S)-binding protein [Clostridium tarantellae]MPQ45118.1 hypothetical protein [Clostridium tarantellae]
MKEFIIDNHQRLGFSPIFAKVTKGEEAFLPGCSFMTLGEHIVLETLNILKLEKSNMAIATTCCGKPSKYIKNGVKFKKRFNSTIELLKSKGIKKIYTACPNCYNTFKENKDLKVGSIWSIIDKNFPQDKYDMHKGMKFALHDPCAARNNSEDHKAIRSILTKMGIEILEFKMCREKSICCGKKNMMMVLEPEKGKAILENRLKQSPYTSIVTYCASCAHSFKVPGFKSYHIMELIFNEANGNGWINRLKLINKLDLSY